MYPRELCPGQDLALLDGTATHNFRRGSFSKTGLIPSNIEWDEDSGVLIDEPSYRAIARRRADVIEAGWTIIQPWTPGREEAAVNSIRTWPDPMDRQRPMR